MEQKHGAVALLFLATWCASHSSHTLSIVAHIMSTAFLSSLHAVAQHFPHLISVSHSAATTAAPTNAATELLRTEVVLEAASMVAAEKYEGSSSSGALDFLWAVSQLENKLTA